MRRAILLLCSSLCILTTSSWAKKPVKRDAKRAESSTVEQRTTSNQDSVRTTLADLFADRVDYKKKLTIENKIHEKELKKELSMEDLEFPAVELYGENSWNSSVNPFTGSAAAKIPDTYDINCSGFQMPINDTYITSNFGYRRRFRRMHYGVDLKLNIGDTVRSAYDGKVRIKDYEGGGYGNYVVVRHPNGLETVYGHLSRSLVSEGQIVKAGQPIALGGNTGRSTGPHLHFETRFMGIPLNPCTIFDFSEGAPLNDVYAFRKGRTSRASYTTTYADKSDRKGRRGKSRMASRRSKGSPQVYKVKKGDNLSTIASRYGVSVSKICATNGISKTKKLIAGKTTLRIP
ncbi:M23 family metallopeptidase [Porphyromonas pogonae]|uniref:M23 family metallopeptidase n=1 Tax=Porphyromonas pogonae TaxID=867595 RepID=UPI002E7999FB|nr:M23 family metallopeptidase [Porphyromonas pogonae]